ncbi:MAG: hypothetical protein MUF55_13745 [Hydrogenophaga sp.]|nr:hypothetical protein [Hydrogenophaga sp.]
MSLRPALTLVTLVMAGLLAGCAAMPERLVTGTPRADIERALGRPTAVIDGVAGTRLQYSRQPAGQQVFNVELDAQGRLRQVDQVMDPAWFARVEVDRWTREDVLRLRHLDLPLPRCVLAAPVPCAPGPGRCGAQADAHRRALARRRLRPGPLSAQAPPLFPIS